MSIVFAYQDMITFYWEWVVIRIDTNNNLLTDHWKIQSV